MSRASGLEAALTAFEDPAAKARDLLRLHRSWAHTHEVPAGARGVVARSWLRQTPEGDKISTPISDHALLARRERSRLLASVVPVLKDRLLPLAHEGLERFGVHPVARDRLLGIVERRCVEEANGASWQARTFRRLYDERGLDREAALREMTVRYRDHMHSNEPVHTWPVE